MNTPNYTRHDAELDLADGHEVETGWVGEWVRLRMYRGERQYFSVGLSCWRKDFVDRIDAAFRPVLTPFG